MTRILIVDDHEVVREGLLATLSADPQFEVVGLAATGRDACQSARRTLPDVALVDWRLPDMSGEELCRRLRQGFPSIAVIVLSTYLSEETVRRSLLAGAAGYVTKASGLPELRAAVERVIAKSPVSKPAGASQIVEQLHSLVAGRASGHRATPQQERVLELAARGLTNEEIGQRLHISESTVRFHIQKLKAKLAARTKTELIARAIRGGVLPPAEAPPSD